MRGQTTERRTEPPRDPAGPAPRAFNVLAKPTGARCNLDCAYCFFVSKERLYPGSSMRMSEEQLDLYLRQLLQAHAGAPEVTVAWQGGEPTLMGLDFFRRSVEIAHKHLQPGQRAIHTIQTNGTLIDAEWAAFLKQNDFLVGISIDGPREIHDAYRVTRGGRGSFDRVMRGLGHLQAAGVEFNTLTTLHAANSGRAVEVYRFLRDDCEARFMQFIPIVERVPGASSDGTLPWSSWRDRPLYEQRGDAVSGRSIGGEQYGRFLIDVFEEWVRRDVGRVFVQMFDVTLANWVGAPPGLCVHSETCGLSLALEHNGDLYSCDHYVEVEHRLGNIFERPILDLVFSPRQQAFGRAKLEMLPQQCLRCEVRFACHGGCPRNRFRLSADGEPTLNHLCDGYRAFFGHVDRPMRIMEDLLAQGRAPAEIMRIYAAEDARRGRNDLCSCGSGRKWKRCHGDTPAARASPT